jgi:hypothetical protein
MLSNDSRESPEVPETDWRSDCYKRRTESRALTPSISAPFYLCD